MADKLMDFIWRWLVPIPQQSADIVDMIDKGKVTHEQARHVMKRCVEENLKQAVSLVNQSGSDNGEHQDN